MNCPMHNLIFQSRGGPTASCRCGCSSSVGLPHEKSGVVHGLTRVRGMTQDDSHSYVTKEQAPAEIKHLLDFCLGPVPDFGLDDYYLELSTRDDSRPDKFVGSDEEWAEATAVLEKVATESGLELVPDPGGAAYYGPKISVQARDAIGRTWQMSTIQYDFNQPRGFELEYAASDGSRQRPVMIHSAKFGSIERFIGCWSSTTPERSRPGSRRCRSRRSRSRSGTTTTCTTWRADDGRRAAGRGRRLRRPDAEEDPQRPAAEGAVHDDRRRPRHRGGCGVRSATATATRTTGCRSTRPCSAWTDAVAKRVQV
jgi:hypothetical protein